MIRKTSAALFFLSAMSFGASAHAAEDVWVVKYPQKFCAEILSQEYSTGGGRQSIQTIEILCRDVAGNYRGFVGNKTSLAGAIGFGRFSMPSIIEYEPYDGNTLQIVD